MKTPRIPKNAIEAFITESLNVPAKKAKKEPKLDVEVRFEPEWSDEFNTLLVDKRGKFYLAVSEYKDGDDKRTEVAACTVKQALKWYVRCRPFADSWEGDVMRLCKQAAKKL